MKIRLLLALSLLSLSGLAQEEKQFQIRTVAFYNLENLFDTENDTLIFDDDRTPEGKDNWTLERYNQKLDNLSRVLSEIGSDVTKTSPDILGICEVENLKVIEDLVNHPSLVDKNYGIVHFDSPDERGIDVALLYKKAVFMPTSFASRRLLLMDDEGERNYTRDQLVVGGLLDDEHYYFLVNHWPSRSGGEARSRPNRMAAAKLSRRIVDSLQKLDVASKIVGMGDFNDDPINDSFKKILRTNSSPDEAHKAEVEIKRKWLWKWRRKKNGDAKEKEADSNSAREPGERVSALMELPKPPRLFNPMEDLYRKGIGSLAYRDKWNLFDQIYFTENLISSNVFKDSDDRQYRFWKAGVFNAPYLVSKKGRYKGYPFRTYAGGSYTGGYSDHFPVYMYLIRKASYDEGRK
ncbi:endonuclease/exonuclease/phosphatase family protein [Pricia sp. S334]|uniref:Endonuclease/exonuclease/phosphatase family protein n=1 Tax=Pricia mediterranea TaxID=3076079 RepID=A0ABU3L5N6_9FLAO|nr:endonuclease/exonuclease/phosphatase family protein [Pricia sp. S334]MDT7828688.1 endonuclease/exonuclease/phosphatase family protein [Pricia sp. S334]